MRELEEFDPKIINNVLIFDCPICKDHRIRLPLSNATPSKYNFTWKGSGEFPSSYSVTPGVDYGCCSGYIKEGKVFFDTHRSNIVWPR